MTITHFVLLVLAVLAATLVGFIIPVLIQLKKTLARVDHLVEQTEKELPPLLRDLGDSAAHVRNITARADEAVQDIGVATGSIRSAAEKIGLLGQFLEKLIIPRVAVVSALVFGIKKGIGLLQSRKKSKRITDQL